MAQDTPSRDLDKYILRLPDGMRESLKSDAEANGRSMNSEIVHRLSAAAKTLRDEFAMAAIPALIARHRADLPWGDIAPTAYRIADAMIAARAEEV